jgi:hypothetical protein
VLSVEADSGGEEARGEDAGVVEDEEVARAEVAVEVGEDVVGMGAGVAVEDEHAGCAADGGRGLGDEFCGEIEVEVGDAHRS